MGEVFSTDQTPEISSAPQQGKKAVQGSDKARAPKNEPDKSPQGSISAGEKKDSKEKPEISKDSVAKAEAEANNEKNKVSKVDKSPTNSLDSPKVHESNEIKDQKESDSRAGTKSATSVSEKENTKKDLQNTDIEKKENKVMDSGDSKIISDQNNKTDNSKITSDQNNKTDKPDKLNSRIITKNSTADNGDVATKLDNDNIKKEATKIPKIVEKTQAQQDLQFQNNDLIQDQSNNQKDKDAELKKNSIKSTSRNETSIKETSNQSRGIKENNSTDQKPSGKKKYNKTSRDFKTKKNDKKADSRNRSMQKHTQDTGKSIEKKEQVRGNLHQKVDAMGNDPLINTPNEVIQKPTAVKHEEPISVPIESFDNESKINKNDVTERFSSISTAVTSTESNSHIIPQPASILTEAGNPDTSPMEEIGFTRYLTMAGFSSLFNFSDSNVTVPTIPENSVNKFTESPFKSFRTMMEIGNLREVFASSEQNEEIIPLNWFKEENF